MANYQLGPIIGKIGGGAEVQKIPVEAVAGGSTGSRVTMHTVHVPEGETWLIALYGNLNPVLTNSSSPQLFIGGESIGPGLPRGWIGNVAEVTGTAEIYLRRNTTSSTDRFSGHVYTVPMP